jgi:hypothetical protein
MTTPNDRYLRMILVRLDDLGEQVDHLAYAHERLTIAVTLRNELIDTLIKRIEADQDHDNWWKDGTDPPC